MNPTDSPQNSTAMKKKAPGNQKEVQDLVPRGMEGKERRILVLWHLIGTVTNKLKCERKVPRERTGELKR
jgi:hypothetical protein